MLGKGDLIKQRYEIVRSLKPGGFGETYLAIDRDESDKSCVVKHLCPVGANRLAMDDAKQRFKREAKQLRNLGQSAQIPALLDFVEEDGELYIVQEWVDGEDLSGEIGAGHALSEAKVLRLLTEILSALQVVHRAQVIHRDLKPANIMRRKADQKLVLVDFGAVKELASSVYGGGNQARQTTYGVFTEGYAAPEQMNGHPLLASDVYAVGAIAVEALTGVSPKNLYDPQRDELVWHHRVKISPEFRQVVDRMLADKAKNRYAGATAALQALQKLTAAASNSTATTIAFAPAAELSTHLPVTVKRRPFLKFLGWGAIGVAGVGGVGRLMNRSEGAKTSQVPVAKSPQIETPKPKIETPKPPETKDRVRVKLEDFEFKTVQLSDRGAIAKRETLQGKLFTQAIDSDVSLKMVQIPAGKFLMGSPADEVGRGYDEGSQREVSLPTFFMSQTPITQAQWRSVAKLFKGDSGLHSPNPSYWEGDQRPVEQVAWGDAQRFCDLLSQVTNLTYRLPSEAEWEYACRSGTKTPFYFGNTITAEVANYDSESSSTYNNGPRAKKSSSGTTDVKIYPANAWGLYDMHGNIWEWCSDHVVENWKSNYYMYRGGCWEDYPVNCRSASRNHTETAGGTYGGRKVGFRVVCISA
jgi:eukaryotic-like serine/threonine-protein kinase